MAEATFSSVERSKRRSLEAFHRRMAAGQALKSDMVETERRLRVERELAEAATKKAEAATKKAEAARKKTEAATSKTIDERQKTVAATSMSEAERGRAEGTLRRLHLMSGHAVGIANNCQDVTTACTSATEACKSATEACHSAGNHLQMMNALAAEQVKIATSCT